MAVRHVSIDAASRYAVSHIFYHSDLILLSIHVLVFIHCINCFEIF